MKTAIVTGANGAIGQELVKTLEFNGIHCIKVDRIGEVNYQCDFTNPEAVNELGLKLIIDFPHIDYLFNVAGIGIYKPIENLEIEEFINSININLIAPFILTKLCLLSMDADSLVLNVGSGMGKKATADRSAYCASKFGLRGMSLSLSKEFMATDICLLTLGSVMDNFGTGGIEFRKKLAKEGKPYLSVTQVVDGIMEIVNSSDRLAEYELFPFSD